MDETQRVIVMFFFQLVLVLPLRSPATVVYRLATQVPPNPFELHTGRRHLAVFVFAHTLISALCYYLLTANLE